jgi:Lon protease-like protein
LQSLWSQLLVEIGAEVAEESRIESEVSFEGLVNRIATSVALQAEEKQALLELSNLVERAKTLDSVLQEQILYWSAIRRFRNLSPNDPRVN